jgi:adenylate cyclase
VAVVSLDRLSADQLNMRKDDWPPSRHVHAALIRRLTDLGVSVIAMDVFFRDRRTPAEDEDLAAAIAESGRVVLFQHVERLQHARDEIVQTRSPIAQLRHAAIASAPFPLPEDSLVRFFWSFFDTTAGNVPTLPAVALQVRALPHLERLALLLREAGAGDLSDLPRLVHSADDLRQVMYVLRRELRGRAGVSTRLVDAIDGTAAPDLPATERRMLVSLVKLYAGDDARYLNYYGPAGRIRTIPFHELLVDPRPVLHLRGAVVFLGESSWEALRAPDQTDAHRTVYSADGVDLSGAEIAATAYGNLLTDRALRPLPYRLDLVLLFGWGFVAGLCARLLPGWQAAAAIGALGAFEVGFAQYLFTRHAALAPLAVPLVVQLPVGLFMGSLLRYRAVRGQVAREIDPDAEADVVDGVCLATDIENYTAASASMDPRRLAVLMNAYYDTLAQLIARRQGLTLGRAGDSAMCVWTGSARQATLTRRMARIAGLDEVLRAADRRSDRGARRAACQAALEARDVFARFTATHAVSLRTRIGLDAGSFALGSIGHEYHVVGAVPNTASRIQNLNKQLGTTILASEAVVRDLDGFCTRPLGRFSLAGVPGETAIVEILGLAGTVDEPTRLLGERFRAALAAFQAGDLSRAAESFGAIAADYPEDGPARYYQSLCAAQGAVQPGGYRPAIRVDTA